MTNVRRLGRALVEGNPWCLIVFLLIFAAGTIGGLFDKLTLADYLGVVPAAGGLLGLGHSVHHAGKRIAERR